MRATAVIVKNDSILLIHRFMNGTEFFVLPGGGVEEGEGIKQATIREIKEETSLDAKVDKKLFEFYNQYDHRMHYFLLVTDFSGNLQLGGEEAQINSEKNKFILEWHKINEALTLPVKPEIVKEKILKTFASKA